VHRRHQASNIPIEILRTVVAISESGSFSKAAERLNLSQPAISTQIKRLQTMVGGPVFERANGGVTYTELGKMILSLARRLLELNDQILLLGGSHYDTRICRVGLPGCYVERFLGALNGNSSAQDVTYVSDHSHVLNKAYNDGYLDIVCMRGSDVASADLVVSWTQPFCWVRSRSFVLSPGRPIPLVSWPGDDQPAIRALEASGQRYRMVFTSPDHDVRAKAVGAGLGFMATPTAQLAEFLTVADEYYLPILPPLKFNILARADKIAKYPRILEAITSIAPRDMALPRVKNDTSKAPAYMQH
jgi:DNA-binding transcriptional LysR family regulator